MNPRCFGPPFRLTLDRPIAIPLSGQAVGALFSLAIPLLTAAVLELFGGNWAVVIWGLLAVCALQFGIISWLVRALAHDRALAMG